MLEYCFSPALYLSPPARVVWIEIVVRMSTGVFCALSPPARVVWIEIVSYFLVFIKRI